MVLNGIVSILRHLERQANQWSVDLGLSNSSFFYIVGQSKEANNIATEFIMYGVVKLEFMKITIC